MRVRSRLVVASLLLSSLALSGCAAAGATPGPSASAHRAATVAAPSATSSATPGDAAPADPSPVVVTIGDSIMAGYGLDPDAAWPALLELDKGITVTNLGCSGAGFTRPGDCGEDFAGLIPQASAQQPTLVIIQSSDNDAGADASDIDDATARTVDALHAAVPGAVIVGLSTLWDQPSAPPATIAAATASLQQAVQRVGGVFVDIGQPLTSQNGLLQADNEHPTPAGQRVLLNTIIDAVHGAGVPL